MQTSTKDRALTAQSPATPGQLSNTIDVITRDLLRAITPENCAWQAAQVMRFTIHHWTTLEEGPGTLAGFRAYSRRYTWRTGTGQERRVLVASGELTAGGSMAPVAACACTTVLPY